MLCDRLAAYPSDPDKPSDIKGVVSIAPGDIETAIKFCKQAKGSRRFSFQLGRAYEASDKTQDAIAAYRRAANQGSTSALASLATLDKKSGGAQSGETRKMFERAAEAGDPVALNNMAMTYATGDGVPLDYVKARDLFSQAARRR